MKHIFLINSFGLKERTGRITKRIEEACKKLKLDYKLETNNDVESTEILLDKYKNDKCIIYAVGGDGILNRVLNQVIGTKNILSYIPTGTGNDFYKTNRDDLEEGTHKVDVVKINDRYFINIACFGIDADIGNSEVFVHNKIIPKSQRYNASLLYHFIKYRPRKLKVIYGKKTQEKKFTTIVVCNGRYYGGGFKMAPSSSVNDGLVDVYLIDNMNKLKLAKFLLDLKNGKHENNKHLEKVRTKKLTIISDKELDSNVDGEIISDTSFSMEVIKNGISIYYNPTLIEMVKPKRKRKK